MATVETIPRLASPISMNKSGLFGLIAAVLLFFPLLGVAQTPVVVELFTSEGCSSCPPADAVLMKLGHQGNSNGTELVLLGEHVDYWNYLGWTDRFSSPQFSQRQSAYGNALHSSVYTPQMVIDGRTQFVGGDLSDAQSRIAEAAKDPKPAQVTLRWEGNNQLHVKVQLPPQARANVLLATTEDGLTTAVAEGENGGRTLHHAAVVRQLRQLGHPEKGVYETTVDVVPQPNWNKANVKVAVLVQETGNMEILGAASIPYAH